MGKFRQFIKRRGIFVLMLLAGLYYGCLALWNLSNTLLYTHEAVVVPATVVDVRQRPFESYTEALKHGNFPWNGDVAYKPILAFSMPGGFHTRALTAPDLDNEDYTRGAQLELIAHPQDPTHCHVYKWKFLWGADSMMLALALLLGVPAWFALFPRRRRKASARTHTGKTPQPRPQHSEPAARSTSAPKAPRRTPAPEEELPFTLMSEEAPPAPKKPRASRKKKETDPNATKKPRAPRKKKETDPAAPPKPRKPRKKKSEA